MKKIIGLEYSIMFGLLAIMLLGVNQAFSQNDGTQFGTYQNEELGISFQYPSNWTEYDENQRKQTTELVLQLLSGQNLTTNEKAYAETVAVASMYNLDPSNLLGVALLKYDFPNSISVEEFNQIAVKLSNAMGLQATMIENSNTTISNLQANKVTIRLDEGPVKGELTSIAFFNGSTVTNLQLGAVNNEAQASVIENIINSIKIDN
jgi:hypothetical protein